MGNSFRRYLVVLLLMAGVLTAGRGAWTETKEIGCLPVNGAPPAEGWLNYCASDRIGDYDHAAVWFGTEPRIKDAIVAAKVLLFGDSRMQEAASQPSVARWFAGRHVPFYLLAFTSGEQSGWAEKLIAKYRPHPAVMIFDTDPYFTGGESLPAQAIAADPAGELKAARAIQSFVDAGGQYCGYLPWLCGRTVATYRSYADGRVFFPAAHRWWFGLKSTGVYPVTPPPPGDTSHFAAYLEHARTLLAEARIAPRCVVFTLIPNSDVDDSLARYLARELGAQVIAPRMDGLTTGDGFHLTDDSAQAWMAAFLTRLQPVLDECAGESLSGITPAAVSAPAARPAGYPPG